MRIAQIGAVGHGCLVVMVGDTNAVYVDDIVENLSRETLWNGAPADLSSADLSTRPKVDVRDQRFGSPLERPTKGICVGLNYRKHAEESGAPVPDEPVLFMKSPDTIQGPNDDIFIPPHSTPTDYEVELAIVIGKPALYLPDAQAAQSVVAGYAISQDVSERHWQLERGDQWDKGKSFPTFNPFGPYLVTPDEFDPTDQRLWCSVNGELRQDSRTADMVFGPAEIVHYISNVMELNPGDVINTGTPHGVGFGFSTPKYLAAGDRVETGVDRLGAQSASIRATPKNTR